MRKMPRLLRCFYHTCAYQGVRNVVFLESLRTYELNEPFAVMFRLVLASLFLEILFLEVFK